MRDMIFAIIFFIALFIVAYFGAIEDKKSIERTDNISIDFISNNDFEFDQILKHNFNNDPGINIGNDLQINIEDGNLSYSNY